MKFNIVLIPIVWIKKTHTKINFLQTILTKGAGFSALRISCYIK